MKTPSLALAAASTLLATSVLAADMPKEGPFDFVACWSGDSREIAFSPRHTANSYEFTGTVRSNPPGGPFDKETFRCVGSGTTFEGKTTGSNTCESTDGAGNKRLTYFTTNADGSVTRAVVAGTGKYEGMSMTTTVQSLGPFPTVKPGTFQSCNRQTGTYKLK